MIVRREATAALKTHAAPLVAADQRDPPKHVGRKKKRTIAVPEASHGPIENQVLEREVRVGEHPVQRVRRKRTPAVKAGPDLAATMTAHRLARVKAEVNDQRVLVGVIAIAPALPDHLAHTKARVQGMMVDQAQANHAAAVRDQKSHGPSKAAMNAHFQKETQRHVDLSAVASAAIGSACRTPPMKVSFA